MATASLCSGKIPNWLSALWHRVPYKQSRAEWGAVVWKCISWPGLLTYLFIYLFNKPFSNGCCHRLLPGLSWGNIRVSVDSAGAFWGEMIGFISPPFQFMCRFCSSRCSRLILYSQTCCTHLYISTSIRSSFHHFSVTFSLCTSLYFLCPSVSASSGSLFIPPPGVVPPVS